MTELVYFLDFTFKLKRTFHDYGDTVRLAEGDWIDVTKCGLVLYSEGKEHARATLRRDHAEKFARPCKRCFR